MSLCYREPSLCHDQMLQLIQNGMGFDLMTVPKCESKRPMIPVQFRFYHQMMPHEPVH